MPDFIRDGKGKGFLAGIDHHQHLMVNAFGISENHFINLEEKQSFLYYSDITPSGAGSVCSFIKNTAPDKIMVVNWYRIWSGANAEALDVHINPTGTPASTTEIVPSNLNLGSQAEPEGDFFEGTGITGITLGAIVDRIRLAGNGEDVISGWRGDIILPQGSSLALAALNGALPLEITISFYYKHIE